ncbi:HDOD domain-containing protein [Vibrio cholerae]|nr:HDOD domain-containing protein [Vibrio cholerae]
MSIFSGVLFSKPEIIKTSKLDENFKANLDLLREVSKTDFSMNIVEKIIGSSATLSFRLLNYVNNQISIRSKIMSLKQAVNYLGKERIKRFASHGVMSMSVPNKPKTLFLCALYRADFICKLSRHISLTKISDKAYIVGILSLIDAMLDNDMSNILGEINLDREIELSLLRKEGMLGELILLVESIEQGDWNGIKRFSLNYSISKKEIMTTYLESVNHVNQENI